MTKARLYGLTTCAHCKSVRNFLIDNRLPFDMIEVDALEKSRQKSAMAELKKLNPRCSFPTLATGDAVIVGYAVDALRKLAADYHRKEGSP